jgi:tRNA pseudouridine38-40 synthase
VEHGVRLTLAYDGAAYAGWQIQPDRQTVQAIVANAAEKVACHPVRVHGASRTDAGVHATGQVAAFATARKLSPVRWALALNHHLPDDIAVRDVSACAPDYRPRYDALDKTYRYLFHLGVLRHPLHHTRSWHLGRLVPRRDASGVRELDLAAMREAAALLLGEHDFRAFRSTGDLRESTTRTLHDITLREHWLDEPELLALEVRGNAFLKHMVRIVAGTLVNVGRGRTTPAQVAAMLQSDAERAHAGMTAPAHGLTLVSIRLGRAREQASPPTP